MPARRRWSHSSAAESSRGSRLITGPKKATPAGGYRRRCGERVIEVNRPDRSTRHHKGKPDPTDAEAAARAVPAGTATGTPKNGDDQVEIIRMLKMTRDSAVKGQTQAVNQLKAILVTAPDELRKSLAALGLVRLLERCAALRPGELTTPLSAAKHALRLLARRALTLRAEAKELRQHLERLTATAAPTLVELTGVGPDTAAALLRRDFTAQRPARPRATRTTGEEAVAGLAGAESEPNLGLRPHPLHPRQLTVIVTDRAPELLAMSGVGAVTAAVVPCVWSHPGQIRSEAARTQITSTCPTPALTHRQSHLLGLTARTRPVRQARRARVPW